MKVFWSRCGHGHGNFGDKLTPLLLKHAGVAVEWAPAEHAELIGVGSILEKAPANFRGTVWTTGLMHESSSQNLPRANVLALRGRLTHQRVTCPAHNTIALGDAGLLCSDLAPASPKRHLLGVIPHFVDAHDPFVRALHNSSPEVRLIDICAEAAEVMRTVAECRHIISSSLHGLILADSLRIPNRWMELNRGEEIVTGAGFKYRDYYSIFDIPTPEPIQLTATSNLDRVLEAIPPFTRPGLETIQAELRRTLASIRDRVRPLTPDQESAREQAVVEWQSRADVLRGVVRQLIPLGTTVVIADDEQIRCSFTCIRALPFTERNGVYWGPPSSEADAISALVDQLNRGATWVIIAWPMSWLLDEFPAFREFLDQHLECRHASEIGQFFQTR